ncbi:SCO family protein [Cyclobacterium amurskyense]|uniref:SCO1/SenC family protein n=1 Tax=Cyclobacterium amurskyense TaxID=320787 RepID=A0A0H4P5G9_9BACT|nr:SCO family protein [Cyclobacterium amurskyense]AKP49656.1 SCO1/SenC family protein [Cyclobacterium amurskyense]|tara:strand:+ start:2553 stop:3152 length:600 start_codon:yes stop_codon:yes gene_type:complete
MKTAITIMLTLVVLLQGCKEQTTSTSITPEEVKELNEMSIYNLPSNWNTQNGNQISFIDLKGQPLVVVMIYTSCQTACPRLVADMRFIEEKVGTKAGTQPRYVLVSIDPLVDTPERLKKFAAENEMNADQWLFLQGTEDSVRDFANILSVKYKKINPMDFSHSNIISVFDKEGVLQYQKEGLGLENDEIVNQILEISKI